MIRRVRIGLAVLILVGGSLTTRAAERYILNTTASAVLLSNGAYPQDQVRTAEGDVRRISEVLSRIGFDVHVERDLTAQDISDSMAGLEAASSEARGVLLVYLKGHGWNDGRSSYFVGVDADLSSPQSVRDRSVDLASLFQTLSFSQAKAVIVILDMCRTKASFAIDAAETGPAEMDKLLPGDTNFVIVYSAAPGTAADEGTKRVSPFGAALSQQLDRMGSKSLADTLANVIRLAPELAEEAGVTLDTRPTYTSTARGSIYLNRFDLSPEIFDERVSSPILDPESLSLCLYSEGADEMEPEECSSAHSGALQAEAVPDAAYDFIAESHGPEITQALGIDGSTPIADLIAALPAEAQADAGRSREALVRDVIRSAIVARPLPEMGKEYDAPRDYYIARLTHSIYCGATGNCPIILFSREHDSGAWKEIAVTGGTGAYFLPGGDEPQLFISNHQGASLTGFSRYLIGDDYAYEESSVMIDYHVSLDSGWESEDLNLEAETPDRE